MSNNKKTSMYQPPKKTKLQIQIQQQVPVMDEKSFPTLINIVKPKENEFLNENGYKDKLNTIELEEDINNKKEDDLPDGWIRFKLDRKQKKIQEIQEKESIDERKEEKMDFDKEYLINFFKKRRESYINLYGEDNYKKVFGSSNYYGSEYIEEIESNHYSDNEIYSKEDE